MTWLEPLVAKQFGAIMCISTVVTAPKSTAAELTER